MKSKTVAVIAAHPDDEILGCGGTIANHIDNGDEVHVLIAAEGLTSRDNKREVKKRESDLSDLQKVALQANQCVGSTTVDFLGIPDNRMDSLDLLDVVKKIEIFKKKYNPEIVYTHHTSDVNIDHQYIYNAVITACRPLPGDSVKTILCFETVSSTEWQPPINKSPFIPTWFTVLSEKHIQKKFAALEVYQSEMRDFPHPRSIKALLALATWRGASVGYSFSEAFVLARNII